jgi:hypothetical protein
MAFEEVSSAGVKYVRATAMKVGESITGHLVGYHNSEKYPEINSLKLQLLADINIGDVEAVAGDLIVLNPAGKLKYFKDDGRLVGVAYRLTREDDYESKRGQTVSGWKIEMDPENKIDLGAAEVVADDAVSEEIPF